MRDDHAGKASRTNDAPPEIGKNKGSDSSLAKQADLADPANRLERPPSTAPVQPLTIDGAESERVGRAIRQASNPNAPTEFPTPSGAASDASPSRLGARPGDMVAQSDTTLPSPETPTQPTWPEAHNGYSIGRAGIGAVVANWQQHAGEFPPEDPRNQLMAKLGAAQTKFENMTFKDMRGEEGGDRERAGEQPSAALYKKALAIAKFGEKFKNDANKVPTAEEMQKLLKMIEGP